MAKYLEPSVIERGVTSQLRIAVTEFKDVVRLDLREWRVFPPNKDFKPTKHGVTINPADLEAVMAALVLHGAQLPVQVINVANAVHYVIVRRDEDAAFHKKNVFKTEAEARDKSPPDGYAIFKLKVSGGAVVRQKRIANRAKGKWADCV